jgi:hypothetical protein
MAPYNRESLARSALALPRSDHRVALVHLSIWSKPMGVRAMRLVAIFAMLAVFFFGVIGPAISIASEIQNLKGMGKWISWKQPEKQTCSVLGHTGRSADETGYLSITVKGQGQWLISFVQPLAFPPGPVQLTIGNLTVTLEKELESGGRRVGLATDTYALDNAVVMHAISVGDMDPNGYIQVGYARTKYRYPLKGFKEILFETFEDCFKRSETP